MLPQQEPAIDDLTSRLQAVVGDSYRILRELGGGGMSRVLGRARLVRLAKEPGA